MSGPRTRSRGRTSHGLRALAACGDGFWELDLLDGSAWYSDWFYQRLGWPVETKRTALEDLRDVLDPGQWERFMGDLRAHLEQGTVLDLRLAVTAVDGRREWWQLKGRAERTDAGLPIHIAGSARHLSDDGAQQTCLCGMFDGWPGAVAILDAEGHVLRGNARWQQLPPEITAAVAQKIRAAGATEPRIDTPVKGQRRRAGEMRLQLTRLERAGAARWFAILEG